LGKVLIIALYLDPWYERLQWWALSRWQTICWSHECSDLIDFCTLTNAYII